MNTLVLSLFLVVVEQAGGRVTTLDPATGKTLGSLAVGFNPHEITVSKDGATAYVSNFGVQDYDHTLGVPGRSVSVIDLASMTEARRLETGEDGGPHGVKLRPPQEGEVFVNAEFPAAMHVFDAKTGKSVRRFAVDGATHNFVFSPDGKALFLMAGKVGVIRVDPETGAETGRYTPATPARGLSWTPDAKFLLVAGKNELALIDPATMQRTRAYENLGVGQILYAEMTPDGRHILAPAVWDSQVLVIDAASGTVARRLITGLDPVAVLIAKDGKTAFVSNARGRHVTAIDLKTWQTRTLGNVDGPNGLAFGNKPVPQKRSPLVLDAVLPFSGPDAAKGREAMLGYELWREEVNAAGGLRVGTSLHTVEIRYEDGAGRTGALTIPAEDATLANSPSFVHRYRARFNADPTGLSAGAVTTGRAYAAARKAP